MGISFSLSTRLWIMWWGGEGGWDCKPAKGHRVVNSDSRLELQLKLNEMSQEAAHPCHRPALTSCVHKLQLPGLVYKTCEGCDAAAATSRHWKINIWKCLHLLKNNLIVITEKLYKFFNLLSEWMWICSSIKVFSN